MPELPEVHTIVSDLKQSIVGYTVVQSWVSAGYYKIKNPSEFNAQVKGRQVIDVKRVAKNILVELDSGDFIHVHLAMTGRVFLLDPKDKSGKKGHVVFHIRNGEDNKIITFTDVRTFGKVAVLSASQVKELEQKYGIEPIAKEMDAKKLYEQLKNKKTIIKNVLMDQSLIAGLGNIYATEALFLARIHPKSKMNKLSFQEFTKLIDSASEVLTMGIKNRGSTLPDKMYVDIWGKPGTQQDHFKIYMQKYCTNCKSPVSYEKIGGRGTYFCRNCQVLKV